MQVSYIGESRWFQFASVFEKQNEKKLEYSESTYMHSCSENQKLIKEKWISSLTEVVIEGPEVDILEKIKIAREKNKEIVRVVEEIKKSEVKVLRDDE